MLEPLLRRPRRARPRDPAPGRARHRRRPGAPRPLRVHDPGRRARRPRSWSSRRAPRGSAACSRTCSTRGRPHDRRLHVPARRRRGPDLVPLARASCRSCRRTSGQLTAVAVAAQGTGASPSRWVAVRHAIAYVAGFGGVFTLLGITATFAGGVLADYMPALRVIGGAILVVMGLSLAGILRIPILERTWRPLDAGASASLATMTGGMALAPAGWRRRWVGDRSAAGSSAGGPGSAPRSRSGAIFAIGWTPCIGVILGGDPDAGRRRPTAGSRARCCWSATRWASGSRSSSSPRSTTARSGCSGSSSATAGSCRWSAGCSWRRSASRCCSTGWCCCRATSSSSSFV